MEHYRDVQAVIDFMATWGIAGIVAVVVVVVGGVVYSELA
jgi:hypothetical protein